MKIYDFKKIINNDDLKEIATMIRNDELVIFPTETVYGVGANALSSKAVDDIFIAKGRANDNPLIVHISDICELEKLTEPPTEMEMALIKAFMPGPFTIILKKRKCIPDNVSANLDTVGIRMPDNKIAQAIIKASGVPIAAPSANLSSRPSGTKVSDILAEFENKVSAIVDGGDTKIGIESTVVKVIDNIPTILRPGKITPDDIKEIVGCVKIDKHIFKVALGPVESPGMKYKHYAPLTKCLLIYNPNPNKQIDLVNKYIIPNTTVIGFKEHKNKIKAHKFYVHGSINDYDLISHNIFSLLRKVDKDRPALIIIEGVAKKGLGIAIMNRLIRSASYNYIDK